MKLCSTPKCRKWVKGDNKTGLCLEHYNAEQARKALARKPRCKVRSCKAVLAQDNLSGFCRPHCYAARRGRTGFPRKVCSTCGTKISAENKSGLCADHLYPCRLLTPEQRALYDDLRPLKYTGAHALEIVLSGKAEEVLSGHKRLGGRVVTVRSVDVIRSVSETMGLNPSEIISGSRFRYVVDARSVCAKVLFDAGMSYPQIARRLGATDHTSAMHWVKRFDAFAPERPLLAEAARRAAA